MSDISIVTRPVVDVGLVPLPRWSALALGVAAVLLTAACTDSGANSQHGSGPIAADAHTQATSDDPKALRPVSVKYQGTLAPVTGIEDTISGNTVVISQPWVGLKTYELRENPIYFRADGVADSPAFIDVPWNVQGNNLCAVGANVHRCYVAYTDDVGQAYLMDKSTSLLAKVSTINSGDSHHVRQQYEERKRQEEAQAKAMMAFAGFLFEAMTAPSVVVCEPGIFTTTCYR
jgi:hypothetical protein